MAPPVEIEVAVVKPHPPAVLHNNFSFAKNRFILEDQPLLKMMAFAYGVSSRQIVGTPDWITRGNWDMSGVTNLSADATISQEQQIVRQLLVDRFGLKFHKEHRELLSYALQVVKGRPKLDRAADPAAQPLEWSEGSANMRTEHYRSSSIGDFLLVKQLFMDRPLVDQTKLAGRFDFKLTYSYGDGPATNEDAATMSTAMREQLGLAFEPVKTTADVLIVDHIEQPTPN
jgi:uncharacterized protein (TIGR03435 family)